MIFRKAFSLYQQTAALLVVFILLTGSVFYMAFSGQEKPVSTSKTQNVQEEPGQTKRSEDASIASYDSETDKTPKISFNIKLPIQTPNKNLPIEIEIIDGQDQKKADFAQNLSFNSETSSFIGNLPMKSLPYGQYSIKVRTKNSLWKIIPSVNIAPGSNPLPETTLVLGDLDQNNELNLADYNLIRKCYGLKACLKKDQADLNLDGKVDELDLNIFYDSILSFRTGD